jgi:hypothetical protein
MVGKPQEVDLLFSRDRSHPDFSLAWRVFPLACDLEKRERLRSLSLRKAAENERFHSSFG